MPEFVADFHIHSRYSRATSSHLTVQELAIWAKRKGVGVLGTGDFTHPQWLQELRTALRGTGRGLFEVDGVRFLLTTEVNTLFSKRGKSHSIHQLLFVPSFESVERINQELAPFGSLSADGRPILHLEAWRLVEIVLGVEPRALVVPAHVWTPWFSLFGSSSGFDAIEDCFEHQTENIFALETGLSSDPAMNWRLSALDRYTLISNSDAHSARRIGREANCFDCELDYDEIVSVLKTHDRTKLLSTIEFFPEEGKYHFDGHRKCQLRVSPEETRRAGFLCPTCGRRLTIGVMHRIEQLADRPAGHTPPHAVPFRHLVPLEEIIAEAIGVGVGTQSVEHEYMSLITRCGTEFDVLLKTPEEELRKGSAPRIAEGILRVRQGAVTVEPGYDGEYGKTQIFTGADMASPEQQMTLFS